MQYDSKEKKILLLTQVVCQKITNCKTFNSCNHEAYKWECLFQLRIMYLENC